MSSSPATMADQQFVFQAEIKQLLHLLSHSLYQNREITIRELVSNASDALDKWRFHCLTSGQKAVNDTLKITLHPDREARVLSISDNGIGMTRDELIANLGTIARSGSLEFLNAVRSSTVKPDDLSLIGQFGVGFYSAFMLADRVEVISRSHSSDETWLWESTGDGTFHVRAAETGSERGTCVRLHLKDGLDEFLEPARLKYILRKYSTFVPHPIELDKEHVNDQPPIWVEPKSSLTAGQYHGFYEYLTHFPGQKPLWYLHLTADSPFQFHSILYCPDKNLEKLGFGRTDHGLHLCARRILVQNDNRKLLPDYLRFLRGIVDSSDLPLNVSREALQDNTVFRKIQKVLTKKVLDHLEQIATDQPADYATFYREFGSLLREGVASDYENRDRIAGLLRFPSTRCGRDELTSLADYVSRCPDAQEQIYFACGTDADAILRDPNLEVFRSRQLEVLVLTDPADEFILSRLGEFQKKSIVSIDSAGLKLPSAPDSKGQPEAASASADVPPAFDRLLDLFKSSLDGLVKDVRKSERLTESACCLVNAEGSMSMTLQKVLRISTPDFEMQKMILELNPSAPLIRRLCELVPNPDQHPFIRLCAEQLHANAMILAGLAPDGQQMATRVQNFMLDLAAGRSVIAT